MKRQRLLNIPAFALVGISLVIVVGVIVTLIVLRQEPAPNQKAPITTVPTPASVSLSGNIACLQLKNPSNGPQTFQCELGMRTDDGSHYRLVNLSQNDAMTSQTKHIRVEGLVSSPADSEPYDITGVISVTSFVIVD